MKMSRRENLDWRQLPNGSGDGRRKKSKSGEDGIYRSAQVGHGDGRRKKRQMVATTQLRLALETEEERRARLDICQIIQSIYLTTFT